jgi:filamentous hemagglutinin family protein
MATYVSWDWQLGLAGFLRISGAITLTGCFAIAFSGNRSLAQITPDATLGAESSIVTPNANVSGFPADLIEGGAARGANLFHSFSQFNIGDGLRVYFANPTGIENILSRVTGSDPSDILGTLGVDGEANLFLLNPNGIIFGSNARLDIGGSFVASTANSLVFNNGLEFSATNPEPPPLLTINVPIGLQYGRQQSGSLVNAGNLAVGQQQNLTLVGGTVAMTGQLSAPGGQISVATVPSETLVQLGQAGEFLSVSPTSNPQSTTPDTLSIAELLNSVDYDTGLTVTPDGQVEIIESGTQISADIGTTIISGSLDASDSSPAQIGGTVQVLGNKVGLFDNARIDVSGDAGGGTALIGGDFQGRGAVPNALRTFIGPNVTINADALTSGDGGQVIAWADEATGFYGNISDRGGAESGNGGFVEVSGKNNLIFRGVVDASALHGNAGTLLLDPVDIIIADGGGDSAADGSNTFQGNNSGIADSILSTPLSAINDTAPTTIFESELNELNALAGNNNIVLQATNNITINDLADNTLTFP